MTIGTHARESDYTMTVTIDGEPILTRHQPDYAAALELLGPAVTLHSGVFPSAVVVGIIRDPAGNVVATAVDHQSREEARIEAFQAELAQLAWEIEQEFAAA